MNHNVNCWTIKASDVGQGITPGSDRGRESPMPRVNCLGPPSVTIATNSYQTRSGHADGGIQRVGADDLSWLYLWRALILGATAEQHNHENHRNPATPHI
jgi:hypothetical protein